VSDADFFDELAARGRNPRWAKVTGAVRFDVRDGESTATTVVRIDHGDVAVERGPRPADCVIALDRPLFERLVAGEENLMALVLRGAAVCSGDPELLLVIQHVFPGAARGAITRGTVR
jgi:hypothetical protein